MRLYDSHVCIRYEESNSWKRRIKAVEDGDVLFIPLEESLDARTAIVELLLMKIPKQEDVDQEVLDGMQK